MNHALIFAGGCGARMENASIPKQFLQIDGIPMIIHTLRAFDRHPEIDDIAVVCIESWIDELKNMIKLYGIKKVVEIVPGGSNGQMSIYNGLNALMKHQESESDIVLVNDGVRPNISEDLITRNIESVKAYGSAISSSPVIETVIDVDGEFAEKVCDRNKQRHAKAPQSFYLSELYDAHERAQKEGLLDFIDSGTMMSYYGKRLHLVDSSVDNIKVTTMKDYYLIEEIWKRRHH